MERQSSAAEEQEGEADGQQSQRQLDPAEGGEELVPPALGIAESIGELHDERSHEHRAGQEERIESREKRGRAAGASARAWADTLEQGIVLNQLEMRKQRQEAARKRQSPKPGSNGSYGSTTRAG